MRSIVKTVGGEPPGSFSRLLSEGMRAKHLDYRTLASLAGVSHTYLWQLAGGGAKAESGKKPKRPSRELAVRLAEILDLDVRKALEAAGHDAAGTPQRPSPAGVVKYAALHPDAPALFSRGLEETRKGNPERAVSLLKEAVAQGGVSFIRAHTGLGAAYLSSRDFEAAITEFSRVLALFDRSESAEPVIDGVDVADVHYNRGLALQDLGRHGAAVRDFEQALAGSGPHRDLYCAALCFSNLALGRFRRVTAVAQEFTLEPQTSQLFTTAALDVRLYQAYSLARLGQYEGAIALAEAVYLLCPSYWYASLVQGAIASRFAGAVALRETRRLKASITAAKRLAGLVRAGESACNRVTDLNPAGLASLHAERGDDFAYFSGLPEFHDYFHEPPAGGEKAR